MVWVYPIDFGEAHQATLRFLAGCSYPKLFLIAPVCHNTLSCAGERCR